MVNIGVFRKSSRIGFEGDFEAGEGWNYRHCWVVRMFGGKKNMSLSIWETLGCNILGFCKGIRRRCCGIVNRSSREC